MLDVTMPEAARFCIGMWGVANIAGQTVGNIANGLLRAMTVNVMDNVLSSYIAVFRLGLVGPLLAAWLLQYVSVDQFQRNAQVRSWDVLELANL